MSRVGKRILQIPTNVEVNITNNTVHVKGPKGTLEYTFNSLINVLIENNTVTTQRKNEEKHTKQLHGTTNSLIASMLKGVSEGFTKEIEIIGVGYKATQKGNQIEVISGYSHPVLVDIPSNLDVKVVKPTYITISGIDKQAVGQFAAILRDIRRPSPYSGKGIMYKGEKIRRKEGKTASK
ncbi:50S ribosomal protein L6 [Mycoplasma miroungirhinis]|uniref:Large ribosomal subunit protein uL6 n=1 Tax=Mycoplasma miroungirhinis TaxID=754516 RepID=A0A6M4JAP9_9MOLU|nr:50S ribosomal protein L6 [Mycoplasma miroungirhinis]QJR43980.1 50S ribosomal protein L6 [Mycoplasma miroungirhinis]